MKRSKRILVLVVIAVTSLLALVGSASAQDGRIPPGPETVLPDYVGGPAKAHPLANSGVPQNPFLAPNGFSSCHLDPWMSDTADVAGPLGIDPVALSSTLQEARQDPLPDPNDGPSWIFVCITHMFDSQGRVITLCFAPHEATAVLADPDTLQVLDHFDLDVTPGAPYQNSGGLARQYFMTSILSSYSYLDARDWLHIVSGGKQITTLYEDGARLKFDGKYDLSGAMQGETNHIAGIMADWQGRIWVTTLGTGSADAPPLVGVLNPAKSSYAAPSVKWLPLSRNEVIRNTFAVTKSGSDRASAYIVTSRNMYRIDAGADDVPHKVWSEPYNSNMSVKNGQYELGSGTTPTVLGEGEYVAVTDNGTQEDPTSMNVVVFRTDAKLDPKEDRVVCKAPVFEDQPGAALSNSLIGSRLSLIAMNTYDYLFDWPSGQLQVPSTPGMERIDIDPNGKGCHKAWYNREVATTTSARLSTRTGLIYTVAREYDASNDVYVYYWVAVDFRTGQTVWKKMAGTSMASDDPGIDTIGDRFDTFYPALAIGPNNALYAGVYGGLITIRDTR